MKKTIILAVSLLIMLLLFTSIKLENNIEYRTYFSQSISDNPNRINHEHISDFSFSPLEDFCTEKNMRVYIGRTDSDTGCIDSYGKIYHYDVIYKDDFWVIGNKTYKSVWN